MHGISKPIFLGKKEDITLSSAEFAQRVLKDNKLKLKENGYTFKGDSYFKKMFLVPFWKGVL